MPEPGRARLEGTTLRREAIAISHDGRQLCDACQFVVSAVGLQVERMFYLFTRPREHAPNPPLRRRLEKPSLAHGVAQPRWVAGREPIRFQRCYSWLRNFTSSCFAAGTM